MSLLPVLEVIHCQGSTWYFSSKNSVFSTSQAIKYTACYQLAFFLFERHNFHIYRLFCHSVVICRVLCRQSFIFLSGEIFCFFSGLVKAYSFASFGLCQGLCGLQMCMLCMLAISFYVFLVVSFPFHPANSFLPK